MQKYFKYFKYFIIALSVIGISFIIIASVTFSEENVSFNNEKVLSFNDNWQFLTEKGDWEPVEILDELKMKEGRNYIIGRDLPAVLYEGTTIALKTDNQRIIVTIDDEKIYESGHPDNNYIGNNAGSYWNMIPISKKYEGCRIQITYTTTSNNRSVTIPKMMIGTKSAILLDIVKDHVFSLIFDSIIMIIGVITIIMYFILRKHFNDAVRILNMGLFSFWSGVWLISTSDLLQFFTGNHFIVTNMGIITFPLMLIFLFNYLYQEANFRLHYIPLVNIGILFSYTIFMITVLFFKWIDLVPVTNTLMIIVSICALVTLAHLIYEYVKFKDRKMHKVLIAFIAIILMGILELVIYFTNKSEYQVIVVRFSVIIFLVITWYSTARNIAKIASDSKLKKHFEEVAYTDLMTNGKNRSAYERDIKDYFKGEQAENTIVTLIIFDINNMKGINDQFGHLNGDQSIKDTYNTIQDSFGKYGTCYRIGGDEFVCLIYNAVDENIKHAEMVFTKTIEEINQIRVYDYNVSYGISQMIIKEEGDFMTLLNQADILQYEDKLRKKNN